jgi:D-alanine transaminase
LPGLEGISLSWKGSRLMEVLACLNGETMPVEQARVPVWDRGFLFGDSVYEVFRMYRGRCWLEPEHFARLRRSLKELEFPTYDIDGLAGRMHRLIAASGIQDGTAYIQITRGVAPRSHAFPDPPVTPTELIVVRPYDDGPTARFRETGVKVISHPDLRWKRCDIKTTNLLGNCIATEAARRAGAFEAILVDSSGFVTESTHTSLIWVRHGQLEGTPEGPEILPGTTRQLILRLIEDLGISFVGCRVTLPELKQADEVILVGTTSEVVPIVQIDEDTIGSGQGGPMSRRLWDAYRKNVERWLAGDSGNGQ